MPTWLQFILTYCIIFLHKLNQFQDRLEFEIPNFFDPLPKTKKHEKLDHYLARISPKQAVRYTKHQYRKFSESVWESQFADTSRYSQRDQELLESLVEMLKFSKDTYQKAYFDSLKRLAEEKN